MNSIKNLFDEKLTPMISEQVATRNSITAKREQIEKDRQAFLEKIKGTTEAIRVLETALDDKVIAGKPTDEVLGKLATRQGELKAFDRQIQRLADEDTEAADALEKANTALSAALGQAIEALRMDIEAMIIGHLQDALETLICFENEAHEAEHALGIELEKDRALSVFRFLNLSEYFKSLGAFLEPCGEDLSAIRRREVCQQLAGKSTDQAA